MISPTTVRTTPPDLAGIHAVVCFRCVRLVIPKINGVPTWNQDLGYWDNASVLVVNVAAYQDRYKAEITSCDGIVCGYNWNTKTASTGTYRLTFVLDGNDARGPVCPVTLAADGTAAEAWRQCETHGAGV